MFDVFTSDARPEDELARALRSPWMDVWKDERKARPQLRVERQPRRARRMTTALARSTNHARLFVEQRI